MNGNNRGGAGGGSNLFGTVAWGLCVVALAVLLYLVAFAPDTSPPSVYCYPDTICIGRS